MKDNIAAVIHDIWAHWMKHMFKVCYHRNLMLEGTMQHCLVIPNNLLKRWERQTGQSFWELSEDERESDREMADMILETLADASPFRDI